jgi:hypothetical protein
LARYLVKHRDYFASLFLLSFVIDITLFTHSSVIYDTCVAGGASLIWYMWQVIVYLQCKLDILTRVVMGALV